MNKLFFTVVALFALSFHHAAFAALSATISASSSTVKVNQPVIARVAINNTSSSALTLNSLQITASYNGASGSKVPAAFSVYPPQSVVLAANATTTVPMTAIFFAPSTGVTGSGTGVYRVGALFSTSDGDVTAAAQGASVTVNPVRYP